MHVRFNVPMCHIRFATVLVHGLKCMYVHINVHFAHLSCYLLLLYIHFQGPPPVGAGLVAPSTSSHPPPPPSSTTLPTTTTTAPYQQPMQLEGVHPVHHHWFYLRHEERYWIPFSLVDSKQLEDVFIMSGHNISQEVREESRRVDLVRRE